MERGMERKGFILGRGLTEMGLKIKFLIDIEKKEVIFFVKQGELKTWVENAIKRFPEKNTDEISDASSNYLTSVFLRVMQEIEKKCEIADWKNFKPKFMTYKKSYELPIDLKKC